MIQGILISRQWEKGLEQSMAHIVMLIIIIIIKKLKASANRDARITWREFEQVGYDLDAEKLYGVGKGHAGSLST